MLEIDFTSIEFIFSCVVLLLFIIQLSYWLGLYNVLHLKHKKTSAIDEHPSELPPLSVLVVTKDSGKMLHDNLVKILEQDYPEFEVIVVNDLSSGEDEDILKLLESEYKNLYHTFIPPTARYISLKKLGIAMGIKASRYDWIVVTEPNCYPVSSKWLRSMASHIDYKADIVLGYSNFDLSGVKASMFYRRMVTDALFNSMRFLGRAIKGKPYMGIGRNMMYRKALYERHKGFARQLNLQRGEDDLFINSLATRRNTRVALGPDSVIRVMAPHYCRLWYAEKVSMLVTGSYYQGGTRQSNGFESITCFLMHLLSLAGVILSALSHQWIILGVIAFLWLVRHFSVVMIMKIAARDMNEKNVAFLPWFDIVRPMWSLQLKMKYWFRTKYDYLRHN